MKKVISLIAVLLVLVCSVNFCFADTSVPAADAPKTDAPNAQTAEETKASPFKDVDANSEIAKSIQKLYDAGVVNGIPESDGTFTYKAANSITRAEFCKMINITFGYTIMADNIFTDVNPSQWYYIHVLPAIHYGYIKGKGDGTFGGTDNITREQVCVILDRIINKKSEKEVVISDEVSPWAADAVKNIVGLGYMDLEEGGKFRATAPMTRGEFAFAIDDFVVIKTPETDKPVTPKPDTGKENEGSTSRPGGINGGNSGNTKTEG